MARRFMFGGLVTDGDKVGTNPGYVVFPQGSCICPPRVDYLAVPSGVSVGRQE